MADQEMLNSDILEGICQEIIEEMKDPVQKTNNLLSFMMSGREPFYAVLEAFQRAQAVEAMSRTVDKVRQIYCHIGISSCDGDRKFIGQPFCNLPDILLRLLLKYSKSITFSNTSVGFGRKLACLRDNERLQTIGFNSQFDTRATQTVLRHIKHVDKLEGSARTFRVAAGLKLDVTTIHVVELLRFCHDILFQDFIVTHISPEFTGLTNLDINCNVADRTVHRYHIICQFERYMDQFDTLVRFYEIDFPDLENLTFHIAADISDFFEETPYAYNKLFEQISIIENNLKVYTGRFQISFDCILEFYELTHLMEDWKIETEKQLLGYVFQRRHESYRTVFDFTKTTQLLPNVELKMTVRCNDDLDLIEG